MMTIGEKRAIEEGNAIGQRKGNWVGDGNIRRSSWGTKHGRLARPIDKLRGNRGRGLQTPPNEQQAQATGLKSEKKNSSVAIEHENLKEVPCWNRTRKGPSAILEGDGTLVKHSPAQGMPSNGGGRNQDRCRLRKRFRFGKAKKWHPE